MLPENDRKSKTDIIYDPQCGTFLKIMSKNNNGLNMVTLQIIIKATTICYYSFFSPELAANSVKGNVYDNKSNCLSSDLPKG